VNGKDRDPIHYRADRGDRSDEQAKAMLVCADHARDGDELIELLQMLGLTEPRPQ